MEIILKMDGRNKKASSLLAFLKTLDFVTMETREEAFFSSFEQSLSELKEIRSKKPSKNSLKELLDEV